MLKKSRAGFTICTHDGIFHADDVMAYEIVRRWAVRGGYSAPGLVRSRRPEAWAAANVIVDVGGKLEVPEDSEAQTWLDHHQKGGAGVRENGVPYASAGLAWNVFGRSLVKWMLDDYGLTAEHFPGVFAAVDSILIQPIDAGDVGHEIVKEWAPGGVRPFTISHVISSMNLRWNETWDDARQEQKFLAACWQVANPVLDSVLRSALASAEAKSLVRNAPVLDRVLLLEQFCPWQDEVFSNPAFSGLLYVVYPGPGEKGNWLCLCVPTSQGAMDQRKPLPADWAGLRDENIQKATGVGDAVFCHAGRFICGAKSKAGALALAQLALDA